MPVVLRFAKNYPERFFDVGIAEEHAVTFAAGLAVGGLHPVVAVYSSFLQRAYDQILHDVCLQNLPVTFAVDRAGLVGSDGETHQGLFDLSFLSSIPNLIVCAPKNRYELMDMLAFATSYNGPVAVRYPRGDAWKGLKEIRTPIEKGKGEWITKGDPDGKVAILAIGTMVKTAMEVSEMLDFNPAVVNMRFIAPLDLDMVREIAENYDTIICMEENVQNGGFCEKVEDALCKLRFKGGVHSFSVPNEFVEHGCCDILKKKLRLDSDSIAEQIREILS